MNGIKHMNKWMHNITEWSTSKLSLNDLKGFLEKTTFKHLPLCLRDNSKNLTRRLRNLSAPQLSLTHDLRMTYASLARTKVFKDCSWCLTRKLAHRLRNPSARGFSFSARTKMLTPCLRAACATFRPPCFQNVLKYFAYAEVSANAMPFFSYALLTPCLCSAYAGRPVPEFSK